MAVLLVLSATAVFTLLVCEHSLARLWRGRIGHVVHVNGTRGKSSVSRLIAAGLASRGGKVLCKTTGTVPMLVDGSGRQHELRRLGRPMISEQLRVLFLAARAGADTLVVECMAVRPAYIEMSERMLRADIGVITNVRLDHLEEMGETLESVARSLALMAPAGGLLFTADQAQAGLLRGAIPAKGAQVLVAEPVASELDFPENVGLACAVCEALGVARGEALDGMRRHYARDPYAYEIFDLPGKGSFVSAFSANDPESALQVIRRAVRENGWEDRPLALMLNNRPDRPSRVRQFVRLVKDLRPSGVAVFGARRRYCVREFQKAAIDAEGRARFAGIPSHWPQRAVIVGIGNLAGEGRRIVDRLRRERP